MPWATLARRVPQDMQHLPSVCLPQLALDPCCCWPCRNCQHEPLQPVRHKPTYNAINQRMTMNVCGVFFVTGIVQVVLLLTGRGVVESASSCVVVDGMADGAAAVLQPGC